MAQGLPTGLRRSLISSPTKTQATEKGKKHFAIIGQMFQSGEVQMHKSTKVLLCKSALMLQPRGVDACHLRPFYLKNAVWKIDEVATMWRGGVKEKQDVFLAP